MPTDVSMRMKKPDWDKRIRRAIELAERHPSAAEVLVFYQHILDFQKALYDDISLRPAPTLNLENSFREQLDINIAIRRLQIGRASCRERV